MNSIQSDPGVQAASAALGIGSGILVVLVLGVLFILLCRELVTWYWKINRIVDALERISSRSDLIYQELAGRTDPASACDIRPDAGPSASVPGPSEAPSAPAAPPSDMSRDDAPTGSRTLLTFEGFSWRRVIVAATAVCLLGGLALYLLFLV